MTVSLPSTKLYIPPARVDIVPRPRLNQKPLVSVNQPLGCGQSSRPCHLLLNGMFCG
jgi:hypothetical protein